MPEKWVSVAEAAASLKVHTRTIERHMKGGKIQTRRADDGQVQVLVEIAEEAPAGLDPLSVVAGQAENQVQLALGTTSAIVRTAQEEAKLARQDAERAWDETRTARRGARLAWSGVALSAAGVIAAVGWTSSKLTAVSLQLDHSGQQAQHLTDEVGQLSDEREHLRTELNLEHERRARAEGELAGHLAVVAGQKPTTRPTARLLDRIASLFGGNEE